MQVNSLNGVVQQRHEDWISLHPLTHAVQLQWRMPYWAMDGDSGSVTNEPLADSGFPGFPGGSPQES